MDGSETISTPFCLQYHVGFDPSARVHLRSPCVVSGDLQGSSPVVDRGARTEWWGPRQTDEVSILRTSGVGLGPGRVGVCV